MTRSDPLRSLFTKSVALEQGYEAFAIHAAHELGLFVALSDDPRTASRLAERAGIPAKSSELLLNCLVNAGFLTLNAEAYTLEPQFLKLFIGCREETAAMLDTLSAQARLWASAALQLSRRSRTDDIFFASRATSIGPNSISARGGSKPCQCRSVE